MGFKACFNKEFLEAKRGKRFFSIFGLSCFFAIFSILYVVIMQFASSLISVEDGELAILFSNTYDSSMGFFAAFITTYFFIVLVIMFSNAISKEINSKQWILPINAGIKPRNLIGAKMLAAFIMVAISFIISAIIHLVLTILICESNGKQVGEMLLAYLSMLIFLEFITIITISLNAISKKRWVPIIVILGTFMLISSTFSNIVIGKINSISSITLNDFTPFFFQTYPLNFMYSISYPAHVWLSAILTTLIISAVLIVWALTSFKVKPEKTTIKSKGNGFLGLFKRKETEEENE